MDTQALARILERVEAGETNMTDAATLRAIFEFSEAPAAVSKATHREGTLSARMGSQATVGINFVRDRYSRGEFQVQTTYRMPDGRVNTDKSHRIYFSGQVQKMIRQLWELVFDETCRALEDEPAEIRLSLNCPELGTMWSEVVRTIAVIVGYELHVVVAGTAQDEKGGVG